MKQNNGFLQQTANWTPIAGDRFYRSKFLRHFPQYRRLFATINVPSDLPMLMTVEHARTFISSCFNTSFSAHRPGYMRTELAHLIPSAMCLPDDLEGYMTRVGKRFNRFHIAVTIRNGYLQRDTVVHELGHYSEQRVATLRGQPPGPLAIRNTAFIDAHSLLTQMKCKPSYFGDLRRAADELVAWMNAIWLCYMLGIDSRTVFVGMLLDSISHPANDTGFNENCLPAVARIFTERTFAERIFNSAGSYTLVNGLKSSMKNNDTQLCKQIDSATSSLLKTIARVAPEL